MSHNHPCKCGFICDINGEGMEKMREHLRTCPENQYWTIPGLTMDETWKRQQQIVERLLKDGYKVVGVRDMLPDRRSIFVELDIDISDLGEPEQHQYVTEA